MSIQAEQKPTPPYLPETGEALYVRIARLLQEEVQRIGNPGAPIESEGKLAVRFNVNRHTIRRAVDDLVAKGLVERRRGVGLFVLNPEVFEYEIHSKSRVSSNLRNAYLRSQTVVLRRFLEPATGLASRWLNVIEGEPLLCVETLRYAEKRPFCIISHFLVYERYKKVYTDYDGGSLHEFIDDQYKLKLRRKRVKISASLPESKDASHLLMPDSLPLLKSKSLNVCVITGTPIEFAYGRHRSDRVEFVTDF